MVNIWKIFDSNLIKKSTKNVEFDFFEGPERGKEEGKPPFQNCTLNYYWEYISWESMKMFLFKFNRNRTITKNYFFKGGDAGKKGTSNSKFYYNVLLVNICKCCVSNSSKIALYMNNLTFLRGGGVERKGNPIYKF